MKLKRWLILSHLIVMLTPIVSGALLFIIINNYNRNTQLTDYISAISKFKSYETKLAAPDMYNGKSIKNAAFISKEDEGSVQIELYNTVGQQIYSSDNNIISVLQMENLYSDLYKIQTGTRAYTLKMPVFNNNTLVGFYQIIIARHSFVKAINYRTYAIILSLALAVMAIFISVMMLLNRKLNKPIKLLVDGMNKFAEGKKDTVSYSYKDEIGELIAHFNSMKNDIEEKRKTIELQQKSKEYMISAISHDLKTPLTAIRAYAESLVEEENSSMENIKAKSKIILNKSDYMKAMIDDLMMYNLLTTDYKMNFVELEGSELFEMLFSGYDESCEKKSIKLGIEINVNKKYSVDVKQMTRVVDNLMTNALRYTPSEGHIYLGAFSSDSVLPDWLEEPFIEKIKPFNSNGIVLIVKNEGQSISADEKEKIFMPFYQSDDSRSKKAWNGVGLGLSVVQLVIEKHNGEAKVFSEGTSTVFACWIPALE